MARRQKRSWDENYKAGRKQVGNHEVAQALLADIVEGSIHTTFDPQQCIPFVKMRGIVLSGINRMKMLFSGGG